MFPCRLRSKDRPRNDCSKYLMLTSFIIYDFEINKSQQINIHKAMNNLNPYNEGNKLSLQSV